jgi:hypothetical protein
LVLVSVSASPPSWPADPGHCEAIDTVLLMAEAEARWDDPRRAAELLDSVERIVGRLPPAYERMRSRCHRATGWRSGL